VLRHESKKDELDKIIKHGIDMHNEDKFYDLSSQLIYEGMSINELYIMLVKNNNIGELEQSARSDKFKLDSLICKELAGHIDMDRLIIELEKLEASQKKSAAVAIGCTIDEIEFC
jgi:hypothetical protein